MYETHDTAKASATALGDVDRQLHILVDMIDRLEKDYEILRVGLEPILREDYPSDAESVGEDREYMVPLAMRLNEMNDRLSCLDRRFVNLHDRISL